MIAIIDYGMGNIHSVEKALSLFRVETIVTNQKKDIASAEKLVLPGVGAFDDAMRELENQGLVSVLKDEIKKKKPFLGICLGMQLLFQRSEEAKEARGLGVLKGEVKKFLPKNGLKVPHMGWNTITKAAACPLLKDLPDNAYVYFCHSYYPLPAKEAVAATTDYGLNFASAVWQANVYGVQFHPEKSQKTGLKIIENFVHLC
ncbi:MAG: imidazole glycerol phosphate synthase subunit HisH [Candidatus Omnitrophota bacterium]